MSVAAAIVLRELSIVRPLPSEVRARWHSAILFPEVCIESKADGLWQDDQHAALAEMMLRTVLSKGVTPDGIQSLCEQTSCQ